MRYAYTSTSLKTTSRSLPYRTRLHKAILMTVYLSAITPSCATVTSMAQLYNRDAAHSSALYVLSTLLSIMTMPLMIGLFDMLV